MSNQKGKCTRKNGAEKRLKLLRENRMILQRQRTPPWTNPEVFAKCMEAFTDEEKMRYTLSEEIITKCIRLTAVLTDKEKALVKQYNKAARFFDSELLMNGAEKGWWPGHTREELRELRLLYSQLMAKYGERSHE